MWIPTNYTFGQDQALRREIKILIIVEEIILHMMKLELKLDREKDENTKCIPCVQNDLNDQSDGCKALDCLVGHNWSPKRPEMQISRQENKIK